MRAKFVLTLSMAALLCIALTAFILQNRAILALRFFTRTFHAHHGVMLPVVFGFALTTGRIMTTRCDRDVKRALDNAKIEIPSGTGS